MDRRIAVRGVIMDGQDKILFMRLTAHEKNGGKQVWCLPGGGLDSGESLLDGLRREIIEETGIEPAIGELLYIQQFKHNDREHDDFIFHIKNAGDYENIDFSATSHGQLEIAEATFMHPTAAYVLPRFLATEDIAAQIYNNSPTKIFNNL